jgi:hypothetical protein
MNTEEWLAWSEAIEIARWLTLLPEIDSALLPKTPSFLQGNSLDLGVGNRFGTDGSRFPDLGPLSSMGNWASVGATMDRKAKELAGFDPVSTVFDEWRWYDYAYMFVSLPFWSSSSVQDQEISISSLSLNPAVNAISNRLSVLASQNTINEVITSVQKIATLAMENKGATQKNNFQQQGVISIKSGNMSMGYFRGSVTMTYKSGKGYQQLTQNIGVQQFYGILDFNWCRWFAGLILEWDSMSVSDWETDTSSANKPPNNSPAWYI